MADVIEDLEAILQRAIDYLSLILNGLRYRLRQNSHRPLNRRNLVRWIAAFMPPTKSPQIRIQRSMSTAPQGLERWGSFSSLRSAYSLSSLNQFVEEDLGGEIVRFRRNTEDDDDMSENVFDDHNFIPSSDEVLNRFTSTPNFNASTCSSLTSSDPAANARLADMEEELSSLRKQIALLVMAQESVLSENTISDKEDEAASTPKAAAVPLPDSPAAACSLDDSGCESETHALGPASLDPSPDEPAPPPPPPPPLPSSWGTPRRKSATSAQNFSKLIMERKENMSTFNSKYVDKANESCPQALSMTDVLKDLNSVKLRAVDRSPGGTPMPRGRLSREPTDPASIIALALKKKFASHRAMSPESDQENDAFSFTSDSNSPFAKTALMKTKRLSMFNDSSDWSPVSTPLKDLNV